MEEKESIFRKESLEKVNSPEQLDKYLRVTSPSVWLILCTIILILIGTIIWGSYGKLETKLDAVCEVKENSTAITCYASEKKADAIENGQEIIIDDQRVKIASIGDITKTTKLDDYIAYSLGLNSSEYVIPVYTTGSFKAGFHKASIVTDSISPLKFVFN